MARKPASRITIDKLNDEGCLNFLEMFLSTLAEDYFSAYVDYVKNSTSSVADSNYVRMREFFLSDYFSLLTNLDGSAVLAGLDKINVEKLGVA